MVCIGDLLRDLRPSTVITLPKINLFLFDLYKVFSLVYYQIKKGSKIIPEQFFMQNTKDLIYLKSSSTTNQ